MLRATIASDDVPTVALRRDGSILGKAKMTL
jgi:hypothetical protein